MIDLILVPYIDCFTHTVSVDIVLRAEEPTWTHAVDLAFGWDTRKLRLIDCRFDKATVENTVAGVPGLGEMPSMPWDFYGANASLDDGNAFFMWLSPLTGAAKPLLVEDDIVATLVFEKVSDTKTIVEVLDVLDIDYPLFTRVYATDVPGYNALNEAYDAKVGSCGQIPFMLIGELQ